MSVSISDLDDPTAVDDLIAALALKHSQAAQCVMLGNPELAWGQDPCAYHSFFMGDQAIQVPEFNVMVLVRLEHCVWRHDRGVVLVHASVRGEDDVYLLTAEFEKAEAGGQIQYTGWRGEPAQTYWDGSRPHYSMVA